MKRALPAVLLVAGLLGGCSDDEPTVSPDGDGAGQGTSSTSPADRAAAAGNVEISVSGNRFQPDATAAKVEQPITWTFRDAVNHTVTADDGSFDSGALKEGATFTHAFSAPGTFSYHCTIHSSMKGTVTVS